ncbi:extracellular solute-binding protein [Ruania alkalisoli]|uniref:Extracellular solute-binding protein n=1 Tax=Ruania alkalisoli TaxID=2779775 RepID=A0A7M1SRY2_9MICO|nr:extracellular solute-binding protein [Ruania alkalisoli]QOR69907.1 extracellular solute-binding protein [Ruania alkalisoli]
MKKRNGVVGFGAAALVAMLAACGMSPQDGGGADSESIDTSGELSGSIDFQTWSLRNEKFTPYFEGLVAAFEAEHPGTTINWMDQPGEGYEEKLLQQVQTGELPDVVNIPPNFAYQLNEVGALVDLEAADAETLGVYTTGGVDAYRFDGAQGAYGYPWYLGTDLNWWNTEEMAAGGVDEVPTTFEEMVDAALTMSENGALPLFSTTPGIGELAAEGVQILQDGEWVFNTPEAAQIIQQYADLYQAGAMPAETLSNDYAGNATLYQQGQVAWTTGTASFATELQNNAPSLVEITETSPRIGTAPLFVQGISVASGSENPELALAFAQYVTNNENQVEFVKLAQGFLPGTLEANENPESFTGVIEDPLVADAVDIAATALPDAQQLQPVEWTDAMNTFAQQQISLALRGDITPEEALDRAVENATTTMG